MSKVLFLSMACIGLVASYVMFKMRYGWYLANADAHFLDLGFLTVACTLVVLWVAFPSRVAVAVVGAALFVFPPLIKPDTFVAIDIPFAALSLIPILLLVIATHFRRPAL
ncbi:MULTISPECIES: hypothetical protein [unclassified Luteibacter]|uniref:hypothetical protein n=1 Tax=Luteibacter sp. PvP019 TaxID=3156436 RepID=UPI003392E33C